MAFKVYLQTGFLNPANLCSTSRSY